MARTEVSRPRSNRYAAWHGACQPADQMSVIGHACSHTGQRARNEDAYVVRDSTGLYAVADGMGGYDGGDVASWIAVDALDTFFGRAGPNHDDDFRWVSPSGETVAEARLALALRQADREIQKRRLGAYHSMGTTMAVLMLAESFGVVAHVGDSRVYRSREGRFLALTDDHSRIVERADACGSGTSVPVRAVTRALGVPGSSSPDFQVIDVSAGDRYLLCSDGLSDVLGTTEMAKHVDSEPPESAVASLVERSCARGAHDNVTAVVVEVAG